MHEFSLAKSLLQVAERHRPAGAQVLTLRVQAGPLQAIEEQAMQWAWQAVRQETPFSHAELQLELLPWSLRCLECGREWQAPSWDAPCACGAGCSSPVGGNELLLTEMELQEP